MAANIFTGTTNSNWGTATNWSLGAVPTATDTNTATFNATSPNCTVNVAAVCNNIDFTGYTNTITMTNGITVSGNVTFDSTMSSRVTGSGSLTINATSAIVTNGATWKNALTFSGTSTTKTITGTLTVTGLFSILNTLTINGGALILNGGLSSVNAGSGTTTITLGGGTWSSTGILGCPLTFAGNSTISGTVNFSGTLTYTSGTITTTGSTIGISGTSTLNVGSIIWNNITLSGTITLLSGLTCTGTLNANGGTINGLYNITVGGSLTVTNTTSGTASIILNGTGTWSGTGTIQNNLTINTAGTITVSGTVNYNTGTLIYTAGTVTTTSSTLTIALSTTLNTSGMTWNNITLTGASQTYTLTSDLNCSGTFTTSVSGTALMNGLYNVNCSGSLSIGASGLGAGTATFVMTGTGTWSGSGFLKNNLTFNTTGTITISGSVSYATGTLTYMSGNVITGGSTLTTQTTVTLNVNGIAWYNVNIAATTVTFTSDLTVNGLLTVSFVYNGANIYANGGISVLNNTGGTTVIWIQGGTWSGTNMLRNNTVINGNITISGSVAFNSATLTYTTGTVVAKGSTLNINGISAILINMHKINFDTVIITSGLTVTMNEFFNGSPNQPVKVQASSTTNYGITFQNGFEKIAKYVKVSNLTLTNTAASRGGLLILNNKGKYFTGGNNIGNIRYSNQSPNGISKGNPSVSNSMTFPVGGYVSDPIFN